MASAPTRVRAVFAYERGDGDSTEYLEFSEGDFIEVISTDSSGWWRGRREKDGVQGLFPYNYVEEVQGAPDDSRDIIRSITQLGNYEVHVQSISQSSVDLLIRDSSNRSTYVSKTPAEVTQFHAQISAMFPRQISGFSLPTDYSSPQAATLVTSFLQNVAQDTKIQNLLAAWLFPGHSQRFTVSKSVGAELEQAANRPRTSTANEVTTAVVIHDYDSTTPGELILEQGEIVTVRRKSESGWWEGSKSDGSRGLFPANFVKERTGMKAPQGANTTNRKTWRRSEAPKPKALPPNARASVLDTQMMGYSLPSLDAFDELTRSSPSPGSLVSLHYTAMWWDGAWTCLSRFASSTLSSPFVFTLGDTAIKEITEGVRIHLTAMKPGDRGILIVSPQLGFGEDGDEDFDIPPGSHLLYDLELVSVVVGGSPPPPPTSAPPQNGPIETRRKSSLTDYALQLLGQTMQPPTVKPPSSPPASRPPPTTAPPPFSSPASRPPPTTAPPPFSPPASRPPPTTAPPPFSSPASRPPPTTAPPPFSPPASRPPPTINSPLSVPQDAQVITDGPPIPSRPLSMPRPEPAASGFDYLDSSSTKVPLPLLRDLDALKVEYGGRIDPTKREQYLDDAEFFATMGMSLVDFNKLPKWRRDKMKRDADLF